MADPALPAELVTEYLARLRTLRDEFLGLLATPAGADRIRHLAHQLRGSGAAYGFPEVTTLAGRLEEAAPELVAERTEALIAHLTKVAPPTPPRVLLVDDDAAILRLLTGVLAAPERELLTAATAADADALLTQGRFDLIILDLFLPDEDGRRLLERWRASAATSATPIFVLSGRLGPEIKTECFTLGADSYFEKPFDPGMLAAAVTSTLRRRAGPLPPPAAAATPPTPLPAVAGARTILLADDDPLIASIVRHRLQKGGHRVDHAPNGTIALLALRSARPDLLILDVKMPELDGLGVLRQVRADPALRTLPVILLTALGEEEDVVRAFDLGADDYLAKPFSPTELAVRVDRLLRRP